MKLYGYLFALALAPTFCGCAITPNRPASPCDNAPTWAGYQLSPLEVQTLNGMCARMSAGSAAPSFFSQQHPGLTGDTGTITALGTAVAEELGGSATLAAMSARFVGSVWDAFMNGAPATQQTTVTSTATVAAPAGMPIPIPKADAEANTKQIP